ncbi:MAG TPA: hypothetical protein VHC01_14960 [Gaiellaceae bacterium]|jgi:hypothetical protein|nr:hypothetical protein [Gaiellaceae bacterium]
MTRVTRVTVERTCAICERTLLMGERAIRFSPNGGSDYVDVCPLCAETAVEYGWIREGAPTTPTMPSERRRRGRGLLGTIMGTRPRLPEETVAAEPILRRLSEEELSIVEAADLFNASQYRRTVGGIGKSLGEPRVSIVVLSGVNAEMVVTVAWDISWYQYRVSPDSDNPVRLEGRGHDPDELESSFMAWNAHMDEDGRVMPDIARL